MAFVDGQPVVDKIYEMVESYFPATDRLKMGQMIWYAVDEGQKAGYGKSLQQGKLRPVIPQYVIHETDIEDIMKGQKKVLVRFFIQSYEQKGVLTHADAASILRLSMVTISKYIQEYEKETGRIVPRRGTIHDMGRSMTHKKIICQKHFAEGKTVEQTAKETYHSPQAVVRYTNDFKRVRECLKEGWNIQRIAYTR